MLHKHFWPELCIFFLNHASWPWWLKILIIVIISYYCLVLWNLYVCSSLPQCCMLRFQKARKNRVIFGNYFSLRFFITIEEWTLIWRNEFLALVGYCRVTFWWSRYLTYKFSFGKHSDSSLWDHGCVCSILLKCPLHLCSGQ